MPIISVYLGIIIRMYYHEHGVPHFHAELQGQKATFQLNGEFLAGNLHSKTALRTIAKWTKLHRAELEENWIRARRGQPLGKILPLD